MKEHWETAYKSKSDQELSWTQSEPIISLALITEACLAGRVIEVGGGASGLSARLIDRGYTVAVLDISKTAIDRATQIQWIVADVQPIPRLV
jgi:2-polyprenyl-3-methyl-5-hydroxy-6-metoxy-1,4-benzoquinol methylase